ncbi:YceI family protein [Ekhidna sp.]|jgi:polyisoprenoid-binding protein YceI|uniref:YceI family protein n=1 Tax=Ekhidna sp. TaxID=2608089 RepID=UPI0032ED917F
MNKFICLMLMLASLACHSQRYKTDSTYIRFFSDAPMEDIEALNVSVSSIIDAAKKTIVIVVPIKSFSFQKKLMQEHFNENYLESDQYPNAIFRGKIQDWGGNTGKTEASATGTLEIHGVTQDVTIAGTLSFNKKQIILETVFPIRLADYDIKIPKAVFYKIAEEVEVTAKLQYKPYEKN